MITDREIADKRNEVTMLRLERDEMLIRRQLDSAKKETQDVTKYKTTIDALKTELRDEMRQKHVAIRLGAEKAATVFSLNETIDELRSTLDIETEETARLRSIIHSQHTHNNELLGIIRVKNKTIDELNEMISDLRMAASDMLDTINECARGEAEDAKALIKVVKAVDTWHRCMIPTSLTGCTDLIKVLDDVLEDYSNAPEIVDVSATRYLKIVTDASDDQPIGDGKIEAIRTLLACGDVWTVHTDEDAIEVMKQKATIDELQSSIDELTDFIRAQGRDVDDRDKHIDGLEETLKLERIDHTAEVSAITNTLHDTTKGLRSRMAGARVIIDNQATSIEELKSTVDFGQSRIDLLVEKKSNCIDELMKDLDARNQVIKDFKAIETKETDRLHTIIEGNGKIIDDLNDMCCDVCGKLEKIEKIAEHPAHDCFSTALDEITKIIQEE